MWDLVGNPEDRFSHNEAQMEVDEVGVDKVGVDEMGSRQSGMTHAHIFRTTHFYDDRNM